MDEGDGVFGGSGDVGWREEGAVVGCERACLLSVRGDHQRRDVGVRTRGEATPGMSRVCSGSREHLPLNDCVCLSRARAGVHPWVFPAGRCSEADSSHCQWLSQALAPVSLSLCL